MSHRVPPTNTTPHSQGEQDPQEERLRALYAAAYLPLDPSEALTQRVAEITAQTPDAPAGAGRLRALVAVVSTAMGPDPARRVTLSLTAAGAGSFVVTLLVALLLSSAAARSPVRPPAGAPVARQWTPEMWDRYSVWLADREASLLPFPLALPPAETERPRPRRSLPARRSQRPASTPAT
jgi:hypothetical protein